MPPDGLKMLQQARMDVTKSEQQRQDGATLEKLELLQET